MATNIGTHTAASLERLETLLLALEDYSALIADRSSSSSGHEAADLLHFISSDLLSVFQSHQEHLVKQVLPLVADIRLAGVR